MIYACPIRSRGSGGGMGEWEKPWPRGNGRSMNRVNYQKALDEILDKISRKERGEIPGMESAGRDQPGGTLSVSAPSGPYRLLLHSCCAPCSSYVLEYLRTYFEITVLYYNPNITRPGEYTKRLEEQCRLIDLMNADVECRPGFADGGVGEDSEAVACPVQGNGVSDIPRHACPIRLQEGAYEPERFLEAARGLEQAPEGGERCLRCYELRLEETARLAAEQGYDYFTTTLTISPLKDAQKLNEIGKRLGEKYGVTFLPSDFKKRNGFKRSVELSERYGLYRQDYCGCIFSERARHPDFCE